MTEQVESNVLDPAPDEGLHGPRWVIARFRQVRMAIHISWILAAVGLIGGSAVWDWWNGGNGLAWRATFFAGLLLACGLIDEIAHFVVARSLGGRKRLLLIGPLGGLGPVVVAPGLPRIVVALAGPLVLIACAMLLGAMSGNPAWIMEPALGPLTWSSWDASGWRSIALVGAWLAIGVALLQLIPMPFSDGAAVLLGFFELIEPRAMAGVRARRTRILIAGVLSAAGVLVAVTQRNYPWSWMFAVAGMLLALAVASPVPVEGQPEPTAAAQGRRRRARWLATYRLKRAHRLEVREAEEVARLDEVLDKLHQQGPGGLSRKERAVLQRASRRLRQSSSSRGAEASRTEDVSG